MFKAAVAAARELRAKTPHKFPPPRQAVLFALYKQATLGDCPQSPPSQRWWLRGTSPQHINQQAWEALRGMPPTLAEHHYVSTVKSYSLK
ncbi:hypothetical protein BASA82_000148 [Batrachochytrium salamandrivorans]|nr:hypothetical protein BASA82_000148 [Batrachochytrium salamandrivorans]